MQKKLEKAVPELKGSFLSRYKLKKSCNNEKVRAIKITRDDDEEVLDVDEADEFYHSNWTQQQIKDAKQKVMKVDGIKKENALFVRK